MDNGVPGAFNILGVRVDPVDMDAAIAAFERVVKADEDPVYVSALGVAGIMEAYRNERMRRILNRSYLNTADGMPLVWIGKLLGRKEIDRVYGPDLMRDVCAYSADKGWTHYLYGGGPGLADKLQARLEQRFPGIRVVGKYTPPFRDLNEDETRELVAEVNQLKPDIFWIGISTPRQLYFMEDYLPKLDVKVIAAVGYAFDVNAGVKKDAPNWIKRSGFQWLHRAITDPRLWRRYLRDNPLFAVLATLQRLHLKDFPIEK